MNTMIHLMNEYQAMAHKFAQYPKIGGHGYLYPAIGLAGETGEILDKIKRIFRDDNSILNSDRREQLGLELGDVLWYISALADELGFSLSEIANKNIEKLSRRKELGKLHGEGDNR